MKLGQNSFEKTFFLKITFTHNYDHMDLLERQALQLAIICWLIYSINSVHKMSENEKKM